MKGLKISKEDKYIDFVGCKSIVLFKWLQLTKDYYVPLDYKGKVQIDLLKPDEHKFANHWSNLRYVTAEENLKKNKRYPTPDEIFKHDVIKKMFLESLEKEIDSGYESINSETHSIKSDDVASEFEYITLDDSELEKEFEKEQDIALQEFLTNEEEENKISH